jgi:hypothetical protein
LSILQKNPLSEFFLKKTPDIGSGAAVYISSGEIFLVLQLRIFKAL